MVWPFDNIVVDVVPDSIKLIFEKFGEFLDSLVLIGLNVYIIIIILIFFLIIGSLFYLPFKFYPLYVQNKKMIDKFIKLGSR